MGTIPGPLHLDKVCRDGDVSLSPEGRVGVTLGRGGGEVKMRPTHGPRHPRAFLVSFLV